MCYCLSPTVNETTTQCTRQMASSKLTPTAASYCDSEPRNAACCSGKTLSLHAAIPVRDSCSGSIVTACRESASRESHCTQRFLHAHVSPERSISLGKCLQEGAITTRRWGLALACACACAAPTPAWPSAVVGPVGRTGCGGIGTTG